ncbi:MAG: LysM peptidoglycan-binding domain-containing protein [Planctomycetes bacterium]|nr:LysM peptidoglycan-binding domain-containing protein [Planctomycetota bacterium]
MQQIERYGVIALVFLLVTIVAVSFWGDSKSPGFWSRLTGKNKKTDEVAKVEPPAVTSEQAIAGGAPLSPTPEGAFAPATQFGTEPQPIGGTLPGTQVPPPVVQDPALAGGQPLANGAPGTQPLGNVAPLGMTPPAPVEPAPAPAAREYTVQKGDSLALIARRTLGSEQRWSEIQALNPGVTPKSLKIGMKLALPEGATVSAQPKTAAVESAPRSAPKTSASKSAPKVATKETPAPKKTDAKGAARYTIQRGDTLSAIAEKKLGNKARVKDILALNPGLDPKKLVVGKSIALPAGGGEKAPLVATAATHSTNSERPRVR